MRPVLIVDDEPLVRVTLRSILDWKRWDLVCAGEASNGEEALAYLGAHPETALVILDLVMPRMDGLELLRRMRERGPLPQVIVLTAHDEFDLVRQAFKLGASDYLLKTELERERLEPLVEAAAARIGRFGGQPGTAGHAIALKQQALQQLLASDEPWSLREELRARGVRLGDVVQLGLLTVGDFEVVAARYDPSSPSSLAVGLIAVVEQVLERRGMAEVLRMDDSEYVLFLSFGGRRAPQPVEESAAVAEEIARALRGYLNIEVSIAWGAPADLSAGFGLASVYRALEAGRSRPSRLIGRARERIRETLQDPDLSLGSLATALGVTPNHLSAQFTRETGRSFREYLAFTRVEAAKRLLSGSTLKVWEVAEQVGFMNVEHFSRVFKKLTGVPPHLFARGS